MTLKFDAPTCQLCGVRTITGYKIRAGEQFFDPVCPPCVDKLRTDELLDRFGLAAGDDTTPLRLYGAGRDR